MTAGRTAFAVNWFLVSRWLPHAGANAPAGGQRGGIGEPRFLSCVVRLPGGIGERLAEAASSLGRIQPEHYLYPPSDIHLTIAGLADLPDVSERVAAAVSGHRPFNVEVHALNVSPGTVFAEFHPRGPGLRAHLRAIESGEHGPTSRWLRRRVAHANVMRFGPPVDPRLIAAVRKLRGTGFGCFEVGEVEVVHTDKVLSGAGTPTLGRLRLG